MMLRAMLFVSLSVRCAVCVPVECVSVRRGQNASLPCLSELLGSGLGVAWYRLRSDELRLLVSASRGKLKGRPLIVELDEGRGRLGLQESAALLISAVGEPDLGLYFCAAAVGLNQLRFGPAVRLTLADAGLSSDGVGRSALWIGVCVSVCVVCVLCGVLCAVLRCRRGSLSPCSRCVEEHSGAQAGPVQYSSIRFIRRSRTPDPDPALVDATYATIAKHTR